MIRPAIRRAVRGAMRFAMNSNTPRYEQIVTGNVVRAMADRVYLDASASGTSDIYNNAYQLAITGGTGSGQSGLINDYVVDSVTNLLTYSEQFDNAAWTKNGVLPFGSGSTANAAIAPDGTLTMDDLVEDTSTGLHRWSRAIASANKNDEVGVSIYVKRSSGTRNVALQITNGTLSYCYVVYDLDTKQVRTVNESGNGILTKAYVKYENGFYQCVLVGTVDITDSSPGFTLYGYIINGSTNSYTGDGLSGLSLWGAQLNIGSTAQEYVPTIATTVTETVRVAHISSNFTTIPQGPADSTYAINKILGVP